jgi:rubredoxin
MVCENPESKNGPQEGVLETVPFMEVTGYWVCPECGENETVTERWE